MAIDGSVTLAPYTLAGVLEPGQVVYGESFLPELDVAGSLEPALALPSWGLAADGLAGNTADGRLELFAPTLDGGIDDAKALPEWTLDALGEAGILMSADLAWPTWQIDAALDQALPLPRYALAGMLLAGNDASGAISFDALTAAGSFGTMADLALPPWALAASGLAGNVLDATLAAPRLTLDATLYGDIRAEGDVTFAPYALFGAISGTIVADAAITLPPFELAASAEPGNSATASLTLPLYALDADGYSSAIGYALIELPAFVLAATMAAQAVPALPNAAALRSCVVLNPRVAAVTLYQGIGANSFANFAGVTLAATEDGIVALVGQDDDGVPIAAHVLAGISDFGSQQMKRVLSAYVGYRAGGDMELTMVTDQHHEYIYRLAPRQHALRIHGARVKLGRGVNGRYWQWRLANVDGASFDMGALRLSFDPLSRGA